MNAPLRNVPNRAETLPSRGECRIPLNDALPLRLLLDLLVNGARTGPPVKEPIRAA
ncbi:MAG: hypothetical protein HYR60_01405 [Acidobacteria bacterium]|nr:hypothetical protein [Acidobacteriota bacterium]